MRSKPKEIMDSNVAGKFKSRIWHSKPVSRSVTPPKSSEIVMDNKSIVHKEKGTSELILFERAKRPERIIKMLPANQYYVISPNQPPAICLQMIKAIPKYISHKKFSDRQIVEAVAEALKLRPGEFLIFRGHLVQRIGSRWRFSLTGQKWSPFYKWPTNALVSIRAFENARNARPVQA